MTVSVHALGGDAGLNGVYDVIVLGAGPVGQNVAARTRAAGLSVAIVERELVGGECSYWGCIPSKSLLRPVIAIADARRIEGAREAVDGSIAPAGVFGRRDRYVTNWNDSGQADSVEAMDVALVAVTRALDGPRRVVVATADDRLVVLAARHAVVDVHGQHRSGTRHTRRCRGEAVDQPTRDRQQHGAATLGGGRCRRSRRRDGYGMAGPRIEGDVAGPHLAPATENGTVRG